MIANLRKLLRGVKEITSDLEEYFPNTSDLDKIDLYEKLHSLLEDACNEMCESVVGLMSRIEDLDTDIDTDESEEDFDYGEDDD